MSRRVTSPVAAPATPPLLETKLLPARAKPELLIRQRLLRQLDQLAPTALTLLDAPVGYGKTVLAQSWCAWTDAAVAWVSLDSGDDDPTRLWTYVATSVDRIRPGLGRFALARLQTPGVPPTVAVDELLNGIAAYGAPLAIVLDDLHELRSEDCLLSLQYAVEHLPSHARIVATTRSDPALPLGRLRARGALGEIRARDLAFTPEEASELLVRREAIGLEVDDVQRLVERTEGWPAGICLAALWLRQLDDPKAGVRDFQGDHRHVVDYLTSEVLDTVDADTRTFLLESSVLGRFNAPLCDAALGRSDSAERLRELEHSNLFVVGLDGHGEWYRYHHLFGQLLQLELANEEPSAAGRIRVRASQWCRQQDLIDDAVEHAAAADDWPLVATILADEHLTLLRSGRLRALLCWCSALPDELLLEHAELPLTAALAAGLLGRPGPERRRFLALGERSLAERPGDWSSYHEAMRGIARVTWVEDDVGEAITLARRTVEIAKAEVPEAAVAALASLGFLLFLAGEHSEARAVAEEALDRPEVSARPHGLVLTAATLSLIDAETGRVEDAEAAASRAVAAATEAGIGEVASGGAARVALAYALAARGKLREAEREAVTGERLRHHPEPEAGHLHAILVLAGIRARRGQLVRAAADLAQVQRGLEAFTDAGRLPTLAGAVETLLAESRTAVRIPSETPSAAELSVLQLLATDLSQREIGARLYVSLNTVKTHTRTLYRKLGVTSREDAVARATALGLLDSSESPG